MTSQPTKAGSPLDVAEQVRRMVTGRYGIAFADLFAADGVLEYPFAAPGTPTRLAGREQIRAYVDAVSARSRRAIEIDDVTLVAHEGVDPEVVVVEIAHSGTSHALGGPYRFEAVGVIRVRDGEIVHYRDYMNPVAMAQLVGATAELATALGAG
ncbi:conserved hypothetical protein [Beutenbergia cavernae DSM 12333]|uniref:SnoaL-like domain-containing protein n=1 Tax=Beutenbergia cavernae (strain ATCC BAA-8 / DSM 12333 / CCUG 43141 / JCM 11478 / NBRC 16432 / NCIMB 13614 / HKI 0122) TaxID=471853 RepID=C5C1G1_BEUC1|nr:nuclear transport factor 2 family protein [Beutenbergia cavernae]ACQ81571.1 conserved hypothetical protein [Beutenbergia cavernae DSM 12333]